MGISCSSKVLRWEFDPYVVGGFWSGLNIDRSEGNVKR